MMVVTAKLKKRNLFIILGAVAAILAILLIPGRKSNEAKPPKAETNEERVAFLEGFGWKVDPNVLETQEVTIPQQTDEVLQRYNELQKAQGFDLTDYAGKVVKRYVYKIINHPDEDAQYQATILVSRGKVIGGDIASTDIAGPMHGFSQRQ